MSLFSRIRNVIFGLLMMITAVVFIFYRDDDGYKIIIIILAIGLAIRAVRYIVFYFTMARHMAGGKMILFQGVILLDFALLTGSLSDVSKIYILLYLVCIHAFSGAVEILRAMEARRTVEGPWKLKFSHGIINILLAISCLVFIRQAGIALIIYGIGLLYSAFIRIITAFRKTSFILIN